MDRNKDFAQAALVTRAQEQALAERLSGISAQVWVPHADWIKL